MSAPPLTRLRRMGREDLDRVMVVEQALFGDEAWTRGMLDSELTQTGSRWYVLAEEGDEVVGYAGLCAYDHEAYVQTIGVRTDRWGQGLGTRLLEALLREAARRGNDEIVLEVRADNDRAQRLYRRYGFDAVGLRRRYYQPSGTDAVVMRATGLVARWGTTEEPS